MNCRGYVHSFEWNERLPVCIEILWLEEERFEDYFKLISQHSSRQLEEKHETSTCVAVKITIRMKIFGEENGHVLYRIPRHLLTKKENNP